MINPRFGGLCECLGVCLDARSSARHNVEYQKNERDDQKQMDEASTDVDREA
jgi:hypothetical protein